MSIFSILASLPSSPSRGGAFAAPPPARLSTFLAGALADALADPPPLVVLRNSGTITLALDGEGASAAAWQIQTIAGDAPALRSLGATADLDTDRSGRFTITATAGGETASLGVVIVDLAIESSLLRYNDAFEDLSSFDALMVGSGEFDLASPSTCAMYVKADVVLSVDGLSAPSARPYLDQIQIGITQSLTRTEAAALYDGGGTERERITGSRRPNPIVGAAAPVAEQSPPILDCGTRRKDFGPDGLFLSQSRAVPETGERRVIEACDSPGVFFDAAFPSGGGEGDGPRIARNEGRISFDLFLVAFSTALPFVHVAFGRASWWIEHKGRNDNPDSGTPEWQRDGCAVGGDFTFSPLDPSKEATAAGAAVGWPVYRDVVREARGGDV